MMMMMVVMAMKEKAMKGKRQATEYDVETSL